MRERQKDRGRGLPWNKDNVADSQESHTWLMTIEHDPITWNANGFFNCKTERSICDCIRS